MLTIYADSENTLTFQTRSSINPSTSAPVMMQPSQTQPTPTLELSAATLVPDLEPPAGFKEYQDPIVGVSIYIPTAWTVMGIVEGSYAIFLSYPEDKYIGGGAFEAGDTKCDLNIQPPNIQMSDVIQLWQDEPRTTIISEEEFRLQLGRVGQRFVIDSMGRATVFITELNQRVITLSCFGDFTIVDEIARTLNVSE